MWGRAHGGQRSSGVALTSPSPPPASCCACCRRSHSSSTGSSLERTSAWVGSGPRRILLATYWWEATRMPGTALAAPCRPTTRHASACTQLPACLPPPPTPPPPARLHSSWRRFASSTSNTPRTLGRCSLRPQGSSRQAGQQVPSASENGQAQQPRALIPVSRVSPGRPEAAPLHPCTHQRSRSPGRPPSCARRCRTYASASAPWRSNTAMAACGQA